MLRGLYTSASGMLAEQFRQDTIANNLANVSTTGFKKDETVFKAFPSQLLQRIHDRLDSPSGASGQAGPVAMAAGVFAAPQVLGNLGQGNMLDASVTNFSDGSVQRTDRPLDLAIQGNALFSVERGDGSRAYTRAGNFSLNGEKQLCTQAGEIVLGGNGQPIVLDGSLIVVDPSGAIQVDGQDAGKLQLTAFDPQRMSKLGDGLYVEASSALEGLGEEAPVEARLQQGFLEQANVSVVTEMVRMIGVMRSYEANQKTIQMQDQSLNKLINEVGRAS